MSVMHVTTASAQSRGQSAGQHSAHTRTSYLGRARVGVGCAVILSLCAFFNVANASSTGRSLHVVADTQIFKMSVDVNELIPVTSVSESPIASAKDGDGNIWVLGQQAVSKVTVDGQVLLELSIGELSNRFGSGVQLRVDPYTNHVWLTSESVLLLIDKQGSVLTEWRSASAIKDIATDLDESVWLLRTDSIVHFDKNGTQLTVTSLSGVIANPKWIALDNARGALLVASPTQVAQMDIGSLQFHSETTRNYSQEIFGIALHPVFGTRWVGTRTGLIAISINGDIAKSIDFDEPVDVTNTRLNLDAGTGSLVIAGSGKAAIFNSSGEFLRRYAVSGNRVEIAVTPYKLLPRLLQTSPANDSSHNSVPQIRYSISGNCNGAFCFPSQKYLDELRFDVRLNGVSLGDPRQTAPLEYEFSPNASLQSGKNVLTAVVEDRFGHKSTKLTTHFQVTSTALVGLPSPLPSLPELIPGSSETTTTPSTSGVGASTSQKSDPLASTSTTRQGVSSANIPNTNPADVKIPGSFEQNRGQAESSIQYINRGVGRTVLFDAGGMAIQMWNPKHPANNPRRESRFVSSPDEESKKPRSEADVVDIGEPRYSMVRMRIVGGNQAPTIEARNELVTKSNYFIGDDPTKWVRNVPHFGEIVYNNILPGVDQVFHYKNNTLEYDLNLQPGIDPSTIAVAFDGAVPSVNANGELVLQTQFGTVVHRSPTSYQMINQQRRNVTSRYVPRSDGTVGFSVNGHDRNYPIVIDPEIVFSTYFGGNYATPYSIATGQDGSIYIAGTVDGPGFTTVNPIPGGDVPTPFFAGDGYVAKISPDGGTLLYASYLGGPGPSYDPQTGSYFNASVANSLAVDSSGSAVVIGTTSSNQFPRRNAWQATFGGGLLDAFVTKLNPEGNDLVYSTYIGGNNKDSAYDVAIDGAGNVAVVGFFNSTNFPIAANGGSGTGYVARFSSSGQFLSGARVDTSQRPSVAVDGSGNIYVTGHTTNPSYPVVGGIPNVSCPGRFVTKYDQNITARVYSTCVVSNSYYEGAGPIAVDAQGSVYIAGRSTSRTYPTVNAFQSVNKITIEDYFYTNAVITKLSPAGNSIVYSSYLGSSGSTAATGLAVAPDGSAYIAGYNAGADFPVVSPLPGTNCRDGYQTAFVTKVSPSGSTLEYSTCIGGTDNSVTYGHDIDVDANGAAYVTGRTNAYDFPLVNPLFPVFTGYPFYETGFIVKLNSTTLVSTLTTLQSSATTVTLGTPVTLTASVAGNGPTGIVSFYDGGDLLNQANLIGGIAVITVNNFSGGVHNITARYNGDGNNSPSASTPIAITVNAPPVVAITTPSSGSYLLNGATFSVVASASVAGGSVSRVELFNGTASLSTINQSPYVYTWSNAKPGTYTLTARATSATGLVTTSSPVTITVGGAPRIDVTSPKSGLITSNARILVTGTVSAPNGSTVRINVYNPSTKQTVVANGLIKADGRFYANDVPLFVDTNVMTVSLTTTDGTTLSQNLVVNRRGDAQFEFSANPVNGFAPLVVNFGLNKLNNASYDHIDLNCGNGGPIKTIQSPSLELDTCTYALPGLYQAQVAVYAAPGSQVQTPIFVGTQTVSVDTAVEVTAAIQGGYFDMLNYLKAKNVTAALNLVAEPIRDRYAAMFNSISANPSLTTILDRNFMDIRDGVIGDGYAELLLVRTEDGEATGYLVNFIRSDDGVWRLEGM